MKIGFFKRLLGSCRIAFGFCPECNSDAPEVDSCPVCEGYRSSELGHTHPPLPATCKKWWERFTQSRCIHGYPMSTKCPDCDCWMQERFASMRNPGDPRRG